MGLDSGNYSLEVEETGNTEVRTHFIILVPIHLMGFRVLITVVSDLVSELDTQEE